MIFDSNPEHERFDEATARQDAFCDDIDNINRAIESEFQDWESNDLALAFRDRDAQRVGEIFMRRVGRRLKRDSEVLG